MPTLRRPRIHPLRAVLTTLGVLVLLAFAAMAVFALVLGHSYDAGRHTVDAFPDAKHRPAKASGDAAGAVNVLLLGTDVDSADPESPQFVGKREADTVMLLHIPADRSKVYAISILRNSLVTVPGHGSQAINSAYAFGGVKLEVQTVEQLLGVRVDHVVDVSLDGVKGLTDALGGVEVRTPTAFANDGYTFPAGTQVLDGSQALAYLRAGDYKASGDATRATAQEQYFRAVLRTVLSAGVLLNPAAVTASVNVFSPYLTTDDGFDAATVAALGVSLRNLRPSDLVTVRVVSDGISTVDGATVVDLDENAVRVLSQALRSDAMYSYSD